nr:MAG TPA: hypothetical protein [Caudoviricetes sp.]
MKIQAFLPPVTLLHLFSIKYKIRQIRENRGFIYSLTSLI